MSYHTELIPCDSSTNSVVVDAILNCHERLGLRCLTVARNSKTRYWKAYALTTSTHVLTPTHPLDRWLYRAREQRYTTVTRAMLMTSTWTQSGVVCLPVIQSNLNHTPADSLGCESPSRLFTAMPPAHSLRSLHLPTMSNEFVDVDQRAIDNIDKSTDRNYTTKQLTRGPNCVLVSEQPRGVATAISTKATTSTGPASIVV